MTLSDLESKHIAIWGLGEEGLASYHFLRDHFPGKPLILINEDLPEDWPEDWPEDDQARFIRQEELTDNIGEIDVVIKTPGISLYHPLTLYLKEHNILVTSATNIWFAQARAGKVIAITGSNGKSTTCALLHHILKGLGHNTELGGNIGRPLLTLAGDADYYIVELSSYQTADLCHAPHMAVLLNLFPEHIQWHQSHDQYFTDKCHLIHTGADTVILNRTDPLTQEKVPQAPKDTLWFNDPAALHLMGQDMMFGTEILGQRQDITLLGRHNHENICAALTVCLALRLDLRQCFALATAYPGLPHRLENLGCLGGRTYINDSISTTPEATLAALTSFEGRPITLLMGGQDRGQNYRSFAQYAHDHPDLKIITAYQTGPKIYKDLEAAGAAMQAIKADDLKDAVTRAQDMTPEGGIILLSPAAPSYDAFKNFEQRGLSFKLFAQNSER